MKKISQQAGRRRHTGYHTGLAIYELKGKFYISSESGTRKATTQEVERFLAKEDRKHENTYNGK